MKTKLLLLVLFFLIGQTIFAQVKLVQPGTWRNWKVYTSAQDTLNKSSFGDTIIVFNAQNKYQFMRFLLTDVAGNSKTDSSVCEVMNKDSVWIRVGCKNYLTGSVNEILVPGDGKRCYYEPIAEYVLAYRVRRINVSYTTKIKSYVLIEAVSP